MDSPQEIEVWYVLPGLRREFVLALKKEGLMQKDIAKLLGITSASVSQYLNNKRGNSLEFSESVKKNIAQSCKKIISKESTFRKELQKAMLSLKSQKYVCGLCHDHVGTEDSCRICYD